MAARNCQAINGKEAFKVSTICTNTRFQPFLPLINRIIHHALLKFSPRRNKPLPQLIRIADWYSTHTLLHHAPDVVIYQIYIRTAGWSHVRNGELECLTVQKLDCVAIAKCWCIVLLEDKHVSSNDVDGQ